MRSTSFNIFYKTLLVSEKGLGFLCRDKKLNKFNKHTPKTNLKQIETKVYFSRSFNSFDASLPLTSILRGRLVRRGGQERALRWLRLRVRAQRRCDCNNGLVTRPTRPTRPRHDTTRPSLILLQWSSLLRGLFLNKAHD